MLTYIVADNVAGDSRLKTFDSNGNFTEKTDKYNDLFGVCFYNDGLDGWVYATQKANNKILKFKFNSSTHTINKQADKIVSWGNQPTNITINNNSIYVTSNVSWQIGRFDLNLDIPSAPPPNILNTDFAPCGFSTNQQGSIGWITDGYNGKVERIDLSTGEKTLWQQTTGQYNWQVACYQNTLFFTSREPQELSWYKQDETRLGSVSTVGYNPTAIHFYYNPITGKIEAAVTFWEGQIWIYEVQEI